MRERFNSRDLIMSAGLMQSMLGETPFADQNMADYVDEDYTCLEDLRVDAMDYEVVPR